MASRNVGAVRVKVEWKGTDVFEADLTLRGQRMKQGVARHTYETATLQRDRALGNMGSMVIGLVTGRSRALYGVRAGAGSFGSNLGAVAAYAGYLAWPDDVVFYPKFLNDGTVKMYARPYHDEAVERATDFFFREAGRVYDYAATGVWDA